MIFARLLLPQTAFVPQHSFAVDLSPAPEGGPPTRLGRRGRGSHLPVAGPDDTSVGESALWCASFDFAVEVTKTPSAPATSTWSAQYTRAMSRHEEGGLQVVIVFYFYLKVRHWHFNQ